MKSTSTPIIHHRSVRRTVPLLLAVAVMGTSLPSVSGVEKFSKPWQRASENSAAPTKERTGLFNRKSKAKAPTANVASSTSKKRAKLFSRLGNGKPKTAATSKPAAKPQQVRVRATTAQSKPVTAKKKRVSLFARLFKSEPRKKKATSGSSGNIAVARKKARPSGPVAPNSVQAPPKYNSSLLAQAKSRGGNVVVNIAQQRARLYVGGQVALDTPISTARSGKYTPRGSFSLGQRVRQGKISTIYNVEMPYWMRLGESAYGMHAGYLPGYPASAGCIRMPYQAAQKMYDATGYGTRVSITGG
ncbi:MAG: lipoprotein-anchoring transpeptidase ErfK/SrfK [Pseudoalteromonas tetraodonis]|jgi:lipoprotein-anchoring transpeptidase ErfK/SrfK